MINKLPILHNNVFLHGQLISFFFFWRIGCKPCINLYRCWLNNFISELDRTVLYAFIRPWIVFLFYSILLILFYWVTPYFIQSRLRLHTILIFSFLRYLYLSIYLSIFLYIYMETNRCHLYFHNLVPIGIYKAIRMPSYTMLNIKMQRDSGSTPWGFRMQGMHDLLLWFLKI